MEDSDVIAKLEVMNDLAVEIGASEGQINAMRAVMSGLTLEGIRSSKLRFRLRDMADEYIKLASLLRRQADIIDDLKDM